MKRGPGVGSDSEGVRGKVGVALTPDECKCLIGNLRQPGSCSRMFFGLERESIDGEASRVKDPEAVRTERQLESERILTRLREVAPPILARHPVDAAYIYGSVARGTADSLSDADVALLLSETLPPYERFMLELTIQGDIEMAGGLPTVDVRAINEAPLMARGRILEQGILFYEQDHKRRVAFEVATRKRYFDFAPFARSLRDAFLERVHREGLLNG